MISVLLAAVCLGHLCVLYSVLIEALELFNENKK